MPEPIYSLSGKRVFVAGHRGMVGSALIRRLASENSQVVTADRSELDLRRQAETEQWIGEARPQVVFLAAGKVGGIVANRDRPGEFLYDNLLIAANVMEASRRAGVEKLIYLGSSCIYPKHAPQPISEEALLTGPLEPTNEAYAVAKIAGIKLAEAYRRQYGCDFISAQPSNLYGPGDNFDLTSGHVLAALIRKSHEAKVSDAPEVVIWGSGTPRREFLHVDDLAEALIFLAQHYRGSSIVNVGTGEEMTIRELSELVADIVGYHGTPRFDTSKPDGTPRKVVDTGLLNRLGWRASISLRQGLAGTYQWFLKHHPTARGF